MQLGRFRLNPFFDPDHRTAPADPAVLRFHQSIDGYKPTPLASLPRLASLLGIASLTVKDESHRFGLNSYKVLGASWAASRLANDPARTFASASAGNFGRALAWACRQVRKDCTVFVSQAVSAARVEEITKLGARVVVVEGNYDDAVRACARQCQALGWRVVSDTAPSPQGPHAAVAASVMEGYRTLFREADWQRQQAKLPEPRVVLIQAGVGGLAGAAVRHYWESGREHRPSIVVVEPLAAACCLESIESVRGSPTPVISSLDSVMDCLNCANVSNASWPDLRAGVRLFCAVHDGWTERAMRALYRPPTPDPRVTAGASGAAALGGLMALLEGLEFASARRVLQLDATCDVMVINTEGDNDPDHFARIVTR